MTAATFLPASQRGTAREQSCAVAASPLQAGTAGMAGSVQNVTGTRTDSETSGVSRVKPAPSEIFNVRLALSR